MRARRAIRCGLLVGAALLLGACQFPPTPWRPSLTPNGHDVGVVGDSLTWGAETGGGFPDPAPARLRDALDAAGYYSMSGFDTGFLADVTDWPQTPDIVVVALGTNDAHNQSIPLDRYLTNIRSFLDRTPAACDVLVNINPATAWGLDVTAPDYNDALEGLGAERSDAVIVDWATIAIAHPEYLSSDGVHGNDEGQAAYRQAIVDGVDACAQELDLPAA